MVRGLVVLPADGERPTWLCLVMDGWLAGYSIRDSHETVHPSLLIDTPTSTYLSAPCVEACAAGDDSCRKRGDGR
jgi:hypothetical protein